MSKEWVDKTVRSVSSGRKVNIVHFNVNDKFVHKGEIKKVREILEEELGMRGYIYASPGSGLKFSDDDTELFFRQASGLPTPPEDPGPMPVDDDTPEADKALWMEKYEDWMAWLEASKKYMDAGVSVLRALPPVSPVDSLTLTQLLSKFISFLPHHTAEEAMSMEEKEVIKPSDFAIIIEYADSYLTQTDNKGFDQKVLSTAVREWAESGNTDMPVVLLTADSLADLDKSLYGRGAATAVIEVPYPDFDERLDFIAAIKDRLDITLGADMDPKAVARETAGLANRHIEAMFSEAYIEDAVLDHEYVRQFKEATLQSELSGLVEVMCPQHGMVAVGGLVKAKATLDKVGGYLRQDKTSLCPMGILFTGPPGTGKTWLAECWAHDLGYTFIKLGTFRSKWVGESERNIAKVFQIAKALAPVIIFVDEIDQEGQRGGENDGGVGSRVFGSILKFMSDTSLRGQVIWVAATNRPDLMDTAMKRPGRFDIRIPFPFPRDRERQDIFRAIVAKYGLEVAADVNFTRLAEMTENHSGADIEALCIESARLADMEGASEITIRHFSKAVEDYMTHHDQKAIKKMEVAAYKECNSRSLLPDDVLKELEIKKSAKESKTPVREA